MNYYITISFINILHHLHQYIQIHHIQIHPFNTSAFIQYIGIHLIHPFSCLQFFHFSGFYIQFLLQSFSQLHILYTFISNSQKRRTSMKNRNDDRKYIFAKEKLLQVERMYKKINQITMRKLNFATERRNDSKIMTRNTKSIEQLRRNKINEENLRLIQRLCETKITVCSHNVKSPLILNHRKTRLNDLVKYKLVQLENIRLAKVLTNISNTNSTRSYFR